MKFTCFLAFAAAAAVVQAVEQQSFGFNGVPGSGYGCDRSCGTTEELDDGSVTVFYTMRASLKFNEIKGTANNPYWTNSTLNSEGQTFGEIPPGTTYDPSRPFSTFGRVWEGVPSESSRSFCKRPKPDGSGTYEMHGIDNPLGPCFQFYRGDKVKIKLINDMDDGMEILKQQKVPLQAYVNLATAADGPPRVGPIPNSPDDMYQDEENMPGHEATYDTTNIHFHGLEMVPHLFHPQGTENPDAPWIGIVPKSDPKYRPKIDNSCYCYVFEIPEDHPQGTYLHHTHRHGTASMQAWSGMLGMVMVGDENTEESQFMELKDQGIDKTFDFILWDFQALNTTRLSSGNNTFTEGDFTPGIYKPNSNLFDPDATVYDSSVSMAIAPILTNDEYQPTFDVCAGEIVNFNMIGAQVGYRSFIRLVAESQMGGLELDVIDEVIDFWVFASDAIAFDKAYKKHGTGIAPGQRQQVLIKLDTVGTYYIMNSKWVEEPNPFLIDKKIQAYIEVTDCTFPKQTSIEKLVFTPGKPNDITQEEIISEVDIAFKQAYIRNKAPFVQFYVNSVAYDEHRMDEIMEVGTSSRWTISSTSPHFHPIHIHVNHFQMEDIQSSSELTNTEVFAKTSTGENITAMDVIRQTNLEPLGMWRDTVQVPPYGFTTIRNRFERFVGKTVFHCHMISHEDNGMMLNLQIRGDDLTPTKSPKKTKSPKAAKKRNPNRVMKKRVNKKKTYDDGFTKP